MKKFTKLFLSCAAVAAITAAVATSAMAADPVTLKGQLAGSTYADGKLTIVAPADMDTTKAATLLVVEGDGTTVEAAKVEGIDQTASGVAFDKTGLKTAPTEGKYKVMLGYYDTNGTFKKATSNLFGAGVKIGDANLDDDITLKDATAIIQYSLKGVALKSDEAMLAADANQDDDVTLKDATAVIQYSLKGVDNGKIGNEI